jgi:hypothetical protein
VIAKLSLNVSKLLITDICLCFAQISSALLAYSEPPTAPGILRALFAGAMPADGAEASPLRLLSCYLYPRIFFCFYMIEHWFS